MRGSDRRRLATLAYAFKAPLYKRLFNVLNASFLKVHTRSINLILTYTQLIRTPWKCAFSVKMLERLRRTCCYIHWLADHAIVTIYFRLFSRELNLARVSSTIACKLSLIYWFAIRCLRCLIELLFNYFKNGKKENNYSKIGYRFAFLTKVMGQRNHTIHCGVCLKKIYSCEDSPTQAE